MVLMAVPVSPQPATPETHTGPRAAGMSLDGHDHEMSNRRTDPRDCVAWRHRRDHVVRGGSGDRERFYEDVFDLPVFFEDENSSVFKFGDTLINLLRTSEAPGLIAPAPVATPAAGPDFNSRSASKTSTRRASDSENKASNYSTGRSTDHGESAPRASAIPAGTFGRSRTRDGILLCASVGNVA